MGSTTTRSTAGADANSVPSNAAASPSICRKGGVWGVSGGCQAIGKLARRMGSYLGTRRAQPNLHTCFFASAPAAKPRSIGRLLPPFKRLEHVVASAAPDRRLALVRRDLRPRRVGVFDFVARVFAPPLCRLSAPPPAMAATAAAFALRTGRGAARREERRLAMAAVVVVRFGWGGNPLG